MIFCDWPYHNFFPFLFLLFSVVRNSKIFKSKTEMLSKYIFSHSIDNETCSNPLKKSTKKKALITNFFLHFPPRVFL